MMMNKHKKNILLVVSIFLHQIAAYLQASQMTSWERQGDYELGCYYFPNYHVDPYNEIEHGPGWTEWDLMKHAKPRFEGHRQPKTPLWGYEDESDPKVMEKKIKAAADHGIDFFNFCWYYYENHEFLNRGLDTGYFGASNNKDVPFCLMWANHDWREWFPIKFNVDPHVIWPAEITPEAFDEMTDLVIEKYFKHPAYYLIEDKPFFSIISIRKFIQGFDSVDDAVDAIDQFRQKTVEAGFSGLHLNLVDIMHTLSRNAGSPEEFLGYIERFGADSMNTYNMQYERYDDFPTVDYPKVVEDATEHWENIARTYETTFFPTISMGWDLTPRIVQSDRFVQGDRYPWLAVYGNNTPENWKEGLKALKDHLDNDNENNIAILNAFNEWTEGSYLEPDTKYGMGYLEAIRDVFGVKDED
jgi:hypothetical protein